MNTTQIKNALKNNPETSRKFCGVFPADKIPEKPDTFPCGFVVNTDPSTEPGTHWVAFFFENKGKGEFFDSYGQPPRHYKELFKPDFESYKWNTRKLQSSWTNVCGQYCIFYLYHRSCGYSMSSFVNMFTDDTEWNDCEVACYVEKHFNVIIPNQPICELNQCCKKLL